MKDMLEILSFCSCGEPQVSLTFIRDVLRTFRDNNTDLRDHIKGAMPLGAWQIILYHLNCVGVLSPANHKMLFAKNGEMTPVDSPWLTPFGEQLLDVLENSNELPPEC